MTVFSRPGTSHNLSMGIVGLPNVGKSTLFNALTLQSVPAENFPFCTIAPEEGRVEFKDERFDFLVDLYKPSSKIPAYLTIFDIAGLIKGAYKGEGLGNQFLDHIRRTDGIFHVVRCFDDTKVIHVDGDTNPLRDVKIIKDELRFKDLEMVENQMNAHKRATVTDPIKKKFETETYKKLKDILDEKWANEVEWTQDEANFVSTLNLLTTKEMIYLANISEDDFNNNIENKHLKTLMNAEKNVLKFSATNLCDNFIKSMIKYGYKSLGLINYFTAGPKEVKSWTIRAGTKAPKAAAVIHSDFEKHFIKAEVMSFDDLKKYGNEQNTKKAGKYLQKGRDYVVEDGDIIYFKTGQVSKKKK
ncbi:putative GTP-binding protein (ODN superfamily) [Pseudoloma neurophilia]|uniref:Obg-like ATPase homolog n=1 Tax=Pseudoloma neurophilia TaxID=146866 RepID=A0A0R0M4W1_9MICR|nr:putative GTP-binding protein (ODN superfamily) [Pseudoloma neurophilia]